MAADIPPRDAPILPVQPNVGIAEKRVAEAADGADQLSGHRGDRRTRHAPAEGQDKQQVKPYVQDRGKQQEQQRRDRIAQTAQKRADEVIEQLRTDTGEDHGAVGIRRPVHLLVVRRDVEPRQHRVQ